MNIKLGFWEPYDPIIYLHGLVMMMNMFSS